LQTILTEFDKEQKKFEREKQRQKGKEEEKSVDIALGIFMTCNLSTIGILRSKACFK